LIKHEIPKVAVDSFVPPANLPSEAARPPKQAHGQRRTNGQRTAVTGNRNQLPRERMTRDGQSQNNKPGNPKQNGQKPQPGQPRPGQHPKNSPHATKPRPPQKTTEQKHLSEAARHQAMPQPALFSPKPAVRRPR
jgi:ATP-dependent RNA helicase RhlE